MCGRFALTVPPEAMAEMFDAIPSPDIPDAGPRYNICPTQTIPVVVAHDGARHLVPMRWGFIPRWYKKPNDGPLLINARAETIATKPAFRDACRSRRCLIPASGFYEWRSDAGKGKEPWYIHPAASNLPLAFGGVWQSWTSPDGDRLVTCAIVTTAASPDIAEIHSRMPLIVSAADHALWLGESGKGAASLLRPASEGVLKRHRVSTKINKIAEDDAALLDPWED